MINLEIAFKIYMYSEIEINEPGAYYIGVRKPYSEEQHKKEVRTCSRDGLIPGKIKSFNNIHKIF